VRESREGPSLKKGGKGNQSRVQGRKGGERKPQDSGGKVGCRGTGSRGGKVEIKKKNT